MWKSILCTAALLAGTGARVDIAATYGGGDTRLRVEARDDGAVRLGPEDGGSYHLVTAEGAFLVWLEASGPKVARHADFEAILGAGLLGDGAEERLLLSRGERRVGEWRGTGFAPAGETEDALVIAEAADLKPIGRAWAQVLRAAPSTIGGMVGMMAQPAEAAALAEQGAPLRIGQLGLERISRDPLPAERFALPARPMSRAEVEAMLSEDDDPGH